MPKIWCVLAVLYGTIVGMGCQNMAVNGKPKGEKTAASDLASRKDSTTANEPVMVAGGFLIECGPAQANQARERWIGCRSPKPDNLLDLTAVRAVVRYPDQSTESLAEIDSGIWHPVDQSMWQVMFRCSGSCQTGRLQITMDIAGESVLALDQELIDILNTSYLMEDCQGIARCYQNIADWQKEFGGIDFGKCQLGDLICLKSKAILRIEGRWNFPDRTHLMMDAWITSKDYNVIIDTSHQSHHQGQKVQEARNYRLVPNQPGNAVEINTPHTILQGFEISQGQAVTGKAVHVRADQIWLDRLMIHGWQGSNSDAIYVNQSDVNLLITNSIFYNIGRSAVMLQTLPNAIQNTTVTIANSLAYDTCMSSSCGEFGGFGSDHRNGSSGLIILNTVSKVTGFLDFFGNIFGESDNNISADASVPGLDSHDEVGFLSKQDTPQSNTFAMFTHLNLPHPDFRPVHHAENQMLRHGADLVDIFQHDITGTRRQGKWSIGPFHCEYFENKPDFSAC